MKERSGERQGCSSWMELAKAALQVALVVATVVVVNKFLFYTPIVSGRSMESNYSNGDMLLCMRVHSSGDVERYDVVTIWLENDQNYPGVQIVKRVYGLPGETISADGDGTIYIDGFPIDDPYCKEQMEDIGALCEPVVLGEGEFFVLGDNRNISDDSRFSVGIVKLEDILGKVWLKLW